MVKKLLVVWLKLRNCLFPLDKTINYNEEELILHQLKEAGRKLDQAWNNLLYAQESYIDIAVIEIHLAETEYSLLNRKYRMIKGDHNVKGLVERTYNHHTVLPWLSNLVETHS